MGQLAVKPDVRFYHNSDLVAAGKAAYLGVLGVHVENCDTTFPKYTPLELEIGQPADNGKEQSRLPVIVTTSSNELMGLTFAWSDSHMLEKWRVVASRFLN